MHRVEGELLGGVSPRKGHPGLAAGVLRLVAPPAPDDCSLEEPLDDPVLFVLPALAMPGVDFPWHVVKPTPNPNSVTTIAAR